MNFSLPSGAGEHCNALPGVPEYFIQVIGEVEREKLPWIWTLEKNKDGFSLILKTPAQAPMRMRRRYFEPQPPVNTDTSPRRQENIEVSSCSVSNIKVPIHDNKTPKKKKSPSCKQRDRNRRRRWKRKKKSPRSLDTRPNASLRDSDHETVQDSLCLANSNQSVVQDRLPTDFVHDTVQDKSPVGTNANQNVDNHCGDDPPPASAVHCGDDPPPASAVHCGDDPPPASAVHCGDDPQPASTVHCGDDPPPASTAHPGDDPPPASKVRRQVPRGDGEYGSDVDDSEDDIGNRCNYCAVRETEYTPLKTCAGCYAVDYCSRKCQRTHWKAGHKQFCKVFDM
jgi:hypothetical protein